MTRAAASFPESGPLAFRLAQALAVASFEALPEGVNAKARLCLLDFLACAFEARDLPWSRQALSLVAPGSAGEASVIGTPWAVAPTEAAFANGVLGHGLVREDMHAGSVCHLGVVVWPAALALARRGGASGRELLLAAALGYELGARVGAALVDSAFAGRFRPTGMVGPLAAAAVGARLLRLDTEKTASALALAANAAAGLNEWAHSGGSEMYFHPGFAARSGVTAALLAAAGAFGSPTALDGAAGLFAAYGGRPEAVHAELFTGRPEILAVYHKPVPVCNFAQTAFQAALEIARERAEAPGQGAGGGIVAIEVRLPQAAASYPGCDFAGPFARVLQAKMSIQYNVAAALLTGRASEDGFDLLEDPELLRLARLTRLVVDEELSRAFPLRQGAEVVVRRAGDELRRRRLDDLVPAGEEEVRGRFLSAAAAAVGEAAAREIAAFVEGLVEADDANRLGELCRAPAG